MAKTWYPVIDYLTCVECGTCRVIGEPGGDIEWSYPRGGYGVLFKFG